MAAVSRPMPLEHRKTKVPSSSNVTPASRLSLRDVHKPVFRDLVDLALLRILDATSIWETRPPRLFPTTETIFSREYTPDDWHKYGDLETEFGTLRHMISSLPERGLPTSCIACVRSILSSGSVLVTWERTLPRLKMKIAAELQWVICTMQNKQRSKSSFDSKLQYLAMPEDYRTSTANSDYAIQLWDRSLSEAVAQVSKGHFEQTRAFLQVFVFLKDPLGGLCSVTDKAVDLFIHMIQSLRNPILLISKNPSLQTDWKAAVAQAAQEALSLSCTLLEHINYIHFTAHQELHYVYVSLDQLPRSEFSIPAHVLRIIEEIITVKTSQDENVCQIAPITVSAYPTLPLEQDELTTVIIDGNHRATATMLLRLIAEHPSTLASSETTEILDRFCIDHGLGTKWKIDLADVLHSLRGSQCAALLYSKMDLVSRFRDVHTIPALVVREDNFHTVCQQRPAIRDRPRLLQPIHQAIYNDEELGFAFPQAGQVHGRTIGFKAMPLT